MPEISRRRLIVCVLGAAIVLVLGARQLGAGPGADGAATAAAGAGGPPEGSVALEESRPASRRRLVVHVAGAVVSPGVYRFPEGARVDDAVRRAGGPTRHADLGAVNLAAELDDGRQVLVPRRVAPGQAAGTTTTTTAAGAAPAQISLATATPEQLEELPGIGPAMAARILAHRQEHGFGNIEELADVPGIGPKRLEAMRELVVP